MANEKNNLQSVRLEMPASVVIGTLGISPFIVKLSETLLLQPS